MEVIDNCPICDSSLFERFVVCKDYTVSGKNFEIKACKSCGLKLTNPRPAENEIGDYYKSESYISHSNTSKGLIDKLYHQVRTITLRDKLNLINSFGLPERKLLDIGCGTGYFLKLCQQDKWQINGIEPDPNARQIAQANTGTEIKDNILSSYVSNTFSVITMWHVLEHVHQLNLTIDWLHQHLTKEGRLVVAVPNHQSDDAKVFNEHWAAYDVPRHLYHFDRSTMKQLMINHGFELVQVRPMIFDAYYVSMLSTKYQTGHVNYIKAVWRGIVSNWKARTTNECSSLIYVFKKF
jgi:2-polyprenyl-3-methyl-5-hydroxy-6-metoxy-1,4-benzoquinol methylase